MTFRVAFATALTLALLVSLPRHARALDPDKLLGECTVERWGARHGLPSGLVRSFAQTADGYLWIAAFGGVVRYDGAGMVNLPEPDAVPRLSDIQNMKLDRDGTLWLVSSHGTPVCVRDSVLGACLPPEFQLPGGARLVDVHPDSDGTVWLAARDELYRYFPGPPARLVTVELPAPVSPVFVHRDRRGRLWLGTQSGLYLQQGDAFTIASTAEGPVRGHVRSFFETPQGRLSVALADHVVRIEDGALSKLVPPGGSVSVNQVLEDRDGNLWLGSNDGLLRHRDGQWLTFRAADGLPEEPVTAVFEDREGSLWVGTSNGGIAQFTDRVVVTQAGPPSLRNARIDSLCQDRTGATWFAIQHDLVRWKDGQERRFGTREGLPDADVLAVTAGAGDEIWVGTKAGLARVRAGRVDFPAAVTKNVATLYLDDAGALWIGQDERLLRWHEGRLEEMARSSGRSIRSIQPDGAGTMWVATSDGVTRLDAEARRLVPVPLPPSAYRVRALHRDREGRLWLTAGTDLFSLSPGPVPVFRAEARAGAPQLFQVIDDDRGYLWVGTGRGLLRLPKRQLIARANGEPARVDPLSLDTSDRRRDVVATKTRQPSAWKDNSGRLWFAADQGPLLVDPARLRLNQHPPAIRIDSATADGRPLRRGVLNQLGPGPGTLEFRFSAVTLLEPHKTLHRYLLEGFDATWVEAGPRRIAYYTNIPPGRYRFRVQGSNADGVWNDLGDVLELQLGTHFYRRGWFFVALGLGALAGVILLWRQRERSLQLQYLAAFAERSRVARELHDTLLQGMSAVALKLRALRRRLGPQARETARELHDIDQLVTSALQETRSFLGELRGQRGPGDLAVALERLAGRLTEGRAIRCVVTVEGTAAALPDEVKGDLFRIAQEAIQNAVKHAHPARIEVKLCHRPDAVTLTVTDDGCGFDDARAAGADDSHYGLLGMRERAARLGELRLASRPGKGTTLEVTAHLGSTVEKKHERA